MEESSGAVSTLICDVDRGSVHASDFMGKCVPSFSDVVTSKCATAFKAKPCFVPTSLSTFRPGDESICCVADTWSPLIGRLFVCGDVLVSVQSFRILFFSQQHASTNATMVVKTNCDVHYFLVKIFFSSCIDWQADSSPYFFCCDLCSPSPSAVLCPPVNLQY